MKIIMVGPQGSGKGTQARILAARLGIPHISTGDLFREKVEKRTELGMVIADILYRGDLVPDDIVIPLANERLAREDCTGGFIADGFPRNLRQVLEIKAVWRIDWVFQLWIDTKTSMERLSSRLVCPACGKIYGPHDLPSTQRVCDSCGTDLVKRSDDQEAEVVIKRLEVYWKEILPVAEYYRSARNFRIIDGTGVVDSVSQQIFKAMDIL